YRQPSFLKDRWAPSMWDGRTRVARDPLRRPPSADPVLRGPAPAGAAIARRGSDRPQGQRSPAGAAIARRGGDRPQAQRSTCSGRASPPPRDAPAEARYNHGVPGNFNKLLLVDLKGDRVEAEHVALPDALFENYI